MFLSLKRLAGTESPKLRSEQTRRACAHQDLHAGSSPATVVRRHCTGVAKCLGLDSFQTRQNKQSEEPQLFLELLRFQEMLLWITQTVQHALGADKTQGIDYETYKRLAAKR